MRERKPCLKWINFQSSGLCASFNFEAALQKEDSQQIQEALDIYYMAIKPSIFIHNMQRFQITLLPLCQANTIEKHYI
jgi:hypothetical protein